jgi:hypothetical protein
MVDKIISSQVCDLSEADKLLLVTRKSRHLRFILFSYIPLALILIYVLITGLDVIYRDRFPYQKSEPTDDEISRFEAVAPIVCGFFFLLLTGYFLKIYLTTVAPFVKDIRRNRKLLVTVKAERTDMGFFNQYYISIPLKNSKQIAVGRDDFRMLADEDILIFEIAPNSSEILKVSNRGKNIAFR